MQSSTFPTRVPALNCLYFALLVSCLFHVLLIAFPCFVKGTDREGAIVASESAGRPALDTTLRSDGEVQTASVASKAQRPRREPGRGASGSSANERDEVASTLSPAAGLNPVPFPRVDYYATNELTVRPRALGEAALDPAEIAAIVASGRIVLDLWINDRGAVVNVAVKHSDLPDVFSQVAVRAFQMLPFTPGELNGRKVGVRMQVEVRYADSSG